MDKNAFLSRSDNLTFSSKRRIDVDHGVCEACGAYSVFTYEQIISDQLATQWRLSKHQQYEISARESMYCLFCTSSLRLRRLASSITRQFSKGQEISLEEAIEGNYFKGLSIAEINSCGVLHGILSGISSLKYSEYGSRKAQIPHQNIMNLTYKTNSLDIILTSDTLEHVPDFEKALRETYRVLKPGGVHIFTVPILMDRKTVHRASFDRKGLLIQHQEASYHGAGQPDYLVINEFGFDFIDSLEAVGFMVTIDHVNLNDMHEPGYVFVARKPSGSKKILPQNMRRIYVDKGSESRAVKLLSNIFSKEELDVVIDSKNDQLTEHQVHKLAWLADKNRLTHNHITNIEEINRSYLQEMAKLGNKIDYLESKRFLPRLQKLLKKTHLSKN